MLDLSHCKVKDENKVRKTNKMTDGLLCSFMFETERVHFHFIAVKVPASGTVYDQYRGVTLLSVMRKFVWYDSGGASERV
jgi:hypothetical protein